MLPMLLEALAVLVFGPLAFLILAGFLCAILYSVCAVCVGVLRGLAAGIERRAIPGSIRQLDVALEDAERQASLGNARGARAARGAIARGARTVRP